MSWVDAAVDVDLDQDTIKHAPEWDPHTPISREYEERLDGYYRQPGYWAPRELSRL